jgi:hypothetical protein
MSVSAFSRSPWLALSFGAACVLAPRLSPIFAQERPMPVLSDTEAYCDQLQARAVTCLARHPELQRLVDEGRQMCDHGQIRGGIARLRRALNLAAHPQAVVQTQTGILSTPP